MINPWDLGITFWEPNHLGDGMRQDQVGPVDLGKFYTSRLQTIHGKSTSWATSICSTPARVQKLSWNRPQAPQRSWNPIEICVPLPVPRKCLKVFKDFFLAEIRCVQMFSWRTFRSPSGHTWDVGLHAPLASTCFHRCPCKRRPVNETQQLRSAKFPIIYSSCRGPCCKHEISHIFLAISLPVQRIISSPALRGTQLISSVCRSETVHRTWNATWITRQVPCQMIRRKHAHTKRKESKISRPKNTTYRVFLHAKYHRVSSNSNNTQLKYPPLPSNIIQ